MVEKYHFLSNMSILILIVCLFLCFVPEIMPNICMLICRNNVDAKSRIWYRIASGLEEEGLYTVYNIQLFIECCIFLYALLLALFRCAVHLNSTIRRAFHEQ